MSEAPRVLSLLSASTEIVCRLGCAHLLVGRSHGCDSPPLATCLPIITAPKVDPNASSLEIDIAVRLQAESGGPVYHIRNAELVALRPTVIITQEQCRICAVTKADIEGVCALMPGVRIVTIKPTSLEDVFGDIITIAGSMDVPERGSQMVRFMRARFDLVRSMTANLTPPKVVHLEWLQPLMGSGYWIAECVESAGCTMIHGTVGGHSQTLESLSTLDSADVIIIAPCGFSIERTFAEINQIQLDKQDQWKALPAVKNGRVFVADGNLYFNRSSCGVLDTAEIVAECAHDSLRGMWGHHGRTFVQMAELTNFCNRDGAPPATKWVELAPADVVVRNNVMEGSEGGAPIRVPLTEASSAVQHVKEQLTALQASEWGAAFALNSAANQARLGSGEQFKAIVHGSPSFSLLLKESGVEEIAATQVTEDFMKAVVRVDVEGGESTTRFLFDLLRGSKEGAWETEGVRIEC